MNIRISHSGSKAHCKGGTRNHLMSDPHAYVGCWGPVEGFRAWGAGLGEFSNLGQTGGLGLIGIRRGVGSFVLGPHRDPTK